MTWRIVTSAFRIWIERNAFLHAAALAFYTLFSLAPLVIIAIAIAGAVFGQDAARGEVVRHLEHFVGTDAARTVQDAVAQSRPALSGLVPAIVGVLALLLGATTVVGQMQQSLNRFFDVAVRPDRSDLVVMLVQRLISLALVVAIGFLLLVSLMLNVGLRAAVNYAGGRLPMPAIALEGLELTLSFVAITALFSLIFRVLPDVVLPWKDVRSGAIVTAVMFVAGRYGFAWYLAYAAPQSTFGAAGSLVLLLLWVYFSSLILFLGAALTKARLLAHGRVVTPRAGAVRVREVIVETDAVQR